MSADYDPKPMSERELEAIIDDQITSAIGWHETEIQEEQEQALDYYYGELFGDEEPGRSSVVSRDVMETIEWLMPDLMRIFTASDEFVRFEPRGEEDVEGAEQETDYVNHVFNNDCDGFLKLYEWFKDALISKNGVIKAWWEDETEVEREEYNNLTEDELALLLQDEALEIESQEMVIEVQADPMTGAEAEVAYYNVTAKRTHDRGRLMTYVIPPEELLIARDAPSVDPQEASFVAHRRKWTVSELREMGYDEEDIRKAGKGDQEAEWSEERINRREAEADWYMNEQWASDEARIEVWVTECYLPVDYDGDGIAELRKVTRAGEVILDNEEVDRVPLHAITPIILTHKFYGMSIADAVEDIQRIRSALWRQILDNLYLTNHGRPTVNENVNLDDLLDSAPGKPTRVRGTADVRASLDWGRPSSGVAEASQMLEYAQSVREERTGVGRNTTGLNPDILKDANTGVMNSALERAQGRVELIARVFAETGVKSLFRHLHELLRKNQSESRTVQLRNKWVTINPTEWQSRESMTVTVGLGTGSRDQRMAGMQMIQGLQEKLMPFGMVGLEEGYETAREVTKLAGYIDTTRFFKAPQEAQQAMQQQQQGQQQGDESTQAYMMVESQKNQIRQMEAQMKAQQQAAENQRKETELMMKQQQQQFDQMIKRAEMAFKAHEQAEDTATARTKLELDSQRDVPGSTV